MASLSFASWVRRGLAAGITREDQTPGEATDTKVQILLQFNNNPNDFARQTDLTLIGPGDIVGLDSRTIVRTFPVADDNDAESAFFAMVEFDQADLPWRYTPARASGDASAKPATDHLRPWLNLIVLEEGGEVDLQRDLTRSSAGAKLPVLSTKLAYLPDLDDSWAWAHVQANETTADGKIDPDQPGTVARVLSPRRLKKQTAYVAFLVPTFLRGVRVGTAATPADWPATERSTMKALELAWDTKDPSAPPDIKLPVYYHWRFQTGSVSSFREAVLSLQAADHLPATVGTRQMDVTSPGLGLPAAVARDPKAPDAPVSVALGGALQSLDGRNATPPTLTNNWRAKLKQFVDAPTLMVDDVPTKVVAPPLYGRWHAAQTTLDPPPPPPPAVPPPASNPPWFATLNTDPRHRVSAAMGTEVVQRDQEALMTSAWAQAANLERINQERRVMQTGVHAFESLLGRHVQVGPIESVLASTALLHGRIRSGTGTVLASLQASALGTGFFEPAWRRLASPTGAIGRRLGLGALTPGQSTGLFKRVNSGAFEPGPVPAKLPGTRTSLDAFGSLLPGGLSTAQLNALVDRLGADQLTFFGLVLFWIARQLLIAENGRFWWLLHRLMRLGLDLVRLAADPQKQRQTLWEKLRDGTFTVADVDKIPQTKTFKTMATIPDLADPTALPPSIPSPGETDSGDAGLFRAALRDLFGYLNRDLTPAPPKVPVDLDAVQELLRNALKPRPHFVAEANARHVRLDGAFVFNPQDPLEPFQMDPTFPQPMCEPLRDISSEWLLPNLNDVPRNTVSALVVNQSFIEAYMVGLSHEMARELIWNRFPTDQRGTFFRQFWDTRGFIPGANEPPRPPESERDIKAIKDWNGHQLGLNSPRDPFDPAVILIRGDVVKRYPNVVVYVAKAPAPQARPRVPDDAHQMHPVFQGAVGSDALYFGFNRTPDQLRNDDGNGWYVVIQERPSEPHFQIPLGDSPIVVSTEIAGAKAAGPIAATSYQPPTRVAIHASELIPA